MASVSVMSYLFDCSFKSKSEELSVITESVDPQRGGGRLFELTSARQVLWDYHSDYGTEKLLFCSYRYLENEIEWPDSSIWD